MERFIICFLIVAIAASIYFFKSVVLEREVRSLRRRYRTNDGTDLRVAYDEMIEEYNSIAKRSNALIKKYNANINDYNQLLARHRANLNNQSYTPPKSEPINNVTLGPNQFNGKEWKRILYALHPDRNGGKTNELWQKMKDLEQPR
jgi:hypothetical protein